MQKKEVERTSGGVVVLDYDDLVSGNVDLSASIEAAFGYDGIGLLTVKNVPGFVEAREELLPLAKQFSALPEEIKDKCVNEVSHYSYGWSHGKEILKPGKFDTFKGSYYNNPQYDIPTEDPEMINKYPEVCLPNIWPSQEDFPKLESAFKKLGSLVVDVGKLVATQCDTYVKSIVPTYNDNTLKNIISNSRTCKARLLHYFAINEDDTPRERDSWCGWHNDHDALTGLCPSMFIDEESGSQVANPDPDAGLYVRTRAGQEFKVNVPKDYIAYQIGETAQILSGGRLMATPHAVQAIRFPESKGISRETFAVFMQPNFDHVINLPNSCQVEEVGIKRYIEGMTFGDWSKVTIENYYKGLVQF